MWPSRWRLLASLLLAPGAALAQDWPARQPVKVIVPLAAGSSTDIIGRTVYDRVAQELGQAFVFENRGGGGTTIGTGAVATAEPDGYTLLVASGSLSVIATSHPKLAFKLPDDLAGVSVLADVPFAVVTPTRYKTLAEFVAAARARSGAMNYGSAGNGSAGHLFMESLALKAGFKAVHVPFRATPEAMNEISAGRLDAFPVPVVNGVELARAGKLSALAVSSAQRVPLLPEVPTIAQAGFEQATYSFWVATFAPRRTPAAIVARLNQAVVKALREEKVAGRILGLGALPRPMTPADTDAFLSKEIAVNAEIIKAAGIKFSQQ